MSQGELIVFDGYWPDLHDAVHSWTGDTFNFVLINNDTIPTRSTITPNLSDFTEVSGPGYAPIALTAVFDQDAGVFRARFTQGTIQWSLNAAGPEDIYYGMIVNASSSNEGIAFVDMTEDGGVTPLSLRTADIQWTPEVSLGRVYTL